MKRVSFLFILLVFTCPSLVFSGIRTCEELAAVVADKPYVIEPTHTQLEWPKSINSKSHELHRKVEMELLPLYRHAQHGYFKTRDGIHLAYSQFKASEKALIQGKPKATIIISHGLGESRPQWLDQIKTFIEEGYDVFIYEHRGQAHSDRQVSNPNKVYVKQFEDYEEDLHEFIHQIVKPRSSPPLYGVAFSLGGLVATANVIKNPDDIEALVAIAPAFQIKTKEYPQSLVKGLTDLMVWFGKEKDYSFHQKDFSPEKLEILRKNTHSEDRWQVFLKLLQTYPLTVPGSLTHGWLSQMLRANQEIQRDYPYLHRPTLVIEASKDMLLDPQVTRKMAQRHPWISHYADPDSYHSIIHESDSIRNPALTEVLRFLVHPERLDDPHSQNKWTHLLAQSENFLERGEIAFALYAANEARVRWSAHFQETPLPESIQLQLEKSKSALEKASRGQQGLFDFLQYRRQEELKKLYP